MRAEGSLLFPTSLAKYRIKYIITIIYLQITRTLIGKRILELTVVLRLASAIL